MRQVQQWAQRRWQEDLKTKLNGRSVGSKTWWTTLKQHQGLTSDDDVPPLHKPDGTVATKNKDKAEVLASFFSNKMSVPDPERPTPNVPALTNASLSTLTITIEDRSSLMKMPVPLNFLALRTTASRSLNFSNRATTVRDREGTAGPVRWARSIFMDGN
ncbi:hypothetical protein Pcinc_021436 [Petrolisthes cinctipes]|uniref:Uncharacterized protein n=1 Tax=Petrolisthes cinctipes TaxID=88211 RepID=A0AAE1FHN3_PETCI|nr:hypothetical protein Pcinc_021436 [Petrolisthes cinctipes]